MEASEKCLSHFVPELMGWARERMHLEAFRLWDGPPGPGGAGGFC